MPRPNQPRNVFAEDNVATRIMVERNRRGWTLENLAERMTKAGCPIVASAIYKTEKGQPRRRIVVDELVAFSQVFCLPIEQLLAPPEVAADAEMLRRRREWTEADARASAAIAERDKAEAEISTYMAKHPQ